MQFQSIARIAGMIILCCGVGIISGLLLGNSTETWYPALTKPSLTPPSWVFGIVWPILYVLMGAAAGILWNAKPPRGTLHATLGLFLLQLLLNGLWTPLFFGLHKIGWALLEIILLWMLILATTIVFYGRSKPAGWLMVPYFAWVSFAVYLNAAFWFLNR